MSSKIEFGLGLLLAVTVLLSGCGGADNGIWATSTPVYQQWSICLESGAGKFWVQRPGEQDQQYQSSLNLYLDGQRWASFFLPSKGGDFPTGENPYFKIPPEEVEDFGYSIRVVSDGIRCAVLAASGDITLEVVVP